MNIVFGKDCDFPLVVLANQTIGTLNYLDRVFNLLKMQHTDSIIDLSYNSKLELVATLGKDNRLFIWDFI